jgi:hypothetical protein
MSALVIADCADPPRAQKRHPDGCGPVGAPKPDAGARELWPKDTRPLACEATLERRDS